MSDARLTLPNRRVALECAVKTTSPGTAFHLMLVKARTLLAYLGDEEFPARIGALQAAVACCLSDEPADAVVKMARQFEDFLSGATPDLAQDS